MTDTEVIAIDARKISITDYCGWNVSTQQIKNILESKYNTRKRYLAKKNISSTANYYYPQVELSQYANQPAELIVTFSAPKLIFGNNLFEVAEKDFGMIVNCLHTALSKMGIEVPSKAIREAKIYSLHIGKNILLKDISCTTMLAAIKKMNFSKKLAMQSQIFDSTEKNVKEIYEPGEQVSVWSKNQQICFYNKSAEIARTQSGQYLLDIYEEYRNTLRFEYRMLKSKTVKKLFAKCGFSEDLTFEELFQNNRLNKLNVYVWNHYIRPNITPACFLDSNPIKVADRLKQLGFSGTKTLKILGAMSLINSDDGFRILKNLFPAKSGVVQSLQKDLAEIPIANNTIEDNPITEAFDKLGSSIINYTPTNPLNITF